MTCQKILQAQNKPYPRTCEECGLGPCKQKEDIITNNKQWVCQECIDKLNIEEVYTIGRLGCDDICFICHKATPVSNLYFVEVPNTYIPQRATPSSLSKINAEQKAVIRDLTDACRSALNRYENYGLEGPDKKKLIEAVKKAEELDGQ